MQISKSDKTLLSPFLARFPEREHDVWLDEAIRLSNIVIRYQALKKKWRLNKLLGKHDFTKRLFEKSSWLNSPNHQSHHRQINQSFTRLLKDFIIFRQTAVMT